MKPMMKKWWKMSLIPLSFREQLVKLNEIMKKDQISIYKNGWEDLEKVQLMKVELIKSGLNVENKNLWKYE